MAAIGREGGESRGAKNRRRQAASRGTEATSGSGAMYSDRESPVEVSRDGYGSSTNPSAQRTRDDMRDDNLESARDEDVSSAT
jgi:hypothetical protein